MQRSRGICGGAGCSCSGEPRADRGERDERPGRHRSPLNRGPTSRRATTCSSRPTPTARSRRRWTSRTTTRTTSTSRRRPRRRRPPPPAASAFSFAAADVLGATNHTLSILCGARLASAAAAPVPVVDAVEVARRLRRRRRRRRPPDAGGHLAGHRLPEAAAVVGARTRRSRRRLRTRERQRRTEEEGGGGGCFQAQEGQRLRRAGVQWAAIPLGYGGGRVAYAKHRAGASKRRSERRRHERHALLPAQGRHRGRRPAAKSRALLGSDAARHVEAAESGATQTVPTEGEAEPAQKKQRERELRDRSRPHVGTEVEAYFETPTDGRLLFRGQVATVQQVLGKSSRPCWEHVVRWREKSCGGSGCSFDCRSCKYSNETFSDEVSKHFDDLDSFRVTRHGGGGGSSRDDAQRSKRPRTEAAPGGDGAAAAAASATERTPTRRHPLRPPLRRRLALRRRLPLPAPAPAPAASAQKVVKVAEGLRLHVATSATSASAGWTSPWPASRVAATRGCRVSTSATSPVQWRRRWRSLGTSARRRRRRRWARWAIHPTRKRTATTRTTLTTRLWRRPRACGSTCPLATSRATRACASSVQVRGGVAEWRQDHLHRLVRHGGRGGGGVRPARRRGQRRREGRRRQ